MTHRLLSMPATVLVALLCMMPSEIKAREIKIPQLDRKMFVYNDDSKEFVIRIKGSLSSHTYLVEEGWNDSFYTPSFYRIVPYWIFKPARYINIYKSQAIRKQISDIVKNCGIKNQYLSFVVKGKIGKMYKTNGLDESIKSSKEIGGRTWLHVDAVKAYPNSINNKCFKVKF